MSTLPAGASAAQVAGTDTVLSFLGPVNAPTSAVVIGEVKTFKNAGFKTATTMTTNFASGGVAQKLPTITDLGNVTWTSNRVSNDPGQLAVIAAQLHRKLYSFTAQIPVNTLIGQTTTGDLITFSGAITSAGAFDISLTDVSEFSFEVDLNSWVVTPGV